MLSSLFKEKKALLWLNGDELNIPSILPKELFCDVNLSQLDVVADKDLIIPRALYANTESTFAEDILRLERLDELKSTKA